MTDAKSGVLCGLISKVIDAAEVTAQSDMECAAKALVGNSEGVW